MYVYLNSIKTNIFSLLIHSFFHNAYKKSILHFFVNISTNPKFFPACAHVSRFTSLIVAKI